MKVTTPRRSISTNKFRKNNNKANSPTFCTMSTLRRIESLLLSTSEEVLNLNDALNCHIDSSNNQFQEMKDKFASLTNTVKVQTNSALTSVQEVFTQTQLIKSDIDVNNKAFINKSNSLWDKLNAVSNEIKSVNLKSSHVNDLTKTVTETPNRKREERISASNKPTPGTYSNAVRSGLPSSSNKPVSLNRTNLGNKHNAQSPTYVEKQRSPINTKYTDREVNSTYPHFHRSFDKKNLFLIGSSTLKKMSPRKMSTQQINTKVKTIRGGRIRDIEDCLIQYISEGRLDCVDVIVIHVGTNNVSDGDSVHAIMDDFKNLICTVRQSLPRTKLVISSILPRPTNSQANRTIYNVNNHLFSLEEQHVEILDNTLDFLYGDQPNLSLFADHVHTNVAGAKVLSHNIISCVNNLFQFSNCTSETESNFQSVRSTGRRFIPFNNTTTQEQSVSSQTYWSETFLSDSVQNKEIDIKGYDTNRKDRIGKSGGGFLIYISNMLTTIRRHDLENDDIESMWIEIIFVHQKPILIGNIYRPPKSNAEWVTKFELMLTNVDIEDKEMIILGDFNINLSSRKIPAKWSHLKNIFNLSQIVSVPTRVTQTSSSLVDHIYSNEPHNIHFISVPKYSISDHYPVCISHKRGLKSKKKIHEYITFRSTKHFNENDFVNDISQCSFNCVLEIDDPEEALLSFLNIFTKVLNHHAPLIKKRVKRLYQNEWMNDDEILDSMRKRDFYHKKKDMYSYRLWRNKVKYLIENSKQNYYTNIIEQKKNNSSKLWKHLHTVSGTDNHTSI
ncbi:Hypothetical predicted protein [Mytilus galloprovincialis]|uniref:Endonuclease/exonuclease/phosphatase domain-containing protein n=1 Tax=Mytilus galloprovincialis TaxID=29158 RepID=A0A8B6E0Y7_MYTGA|nr:Hypothetical predicted protein [Mytilus galloprovincialis]